MENFMPALIISSILLWLISLINLLLTFALIKKINERSNEPGLDWLEIGSRAPYFQETNLDNEMLTLDSFIGRSILFTFLTPHCRSCSELIPQLPEIANSIKNDDIELVIVSLVGNEETREFVTEHDIRLPVIVAPRHSSDFAKNYRVGATPFFCLVDTNRYVQDVGYFSPEWDEDRSKWLFNLDKKKNYE